MSSWCRAGERPERDAQVAPGSRLGVGDGCDRRHRYGSVASMYKVRAASAGPRMHAKCLPHATGSIHDAAHAAGCATCR
eukprot:4870028-Prymnesium_polylepis.1